MLVGVAVVQEPQLVLEVTVVMVQDMAELLIVDLVQEVVQALAPVAEAVVDQEFVFLNLIRVILNRVQENLT